MLVGRWGGHRGWTSEPGDGERRVVGISEPVRRTLAFTLCARPSQCRVSRGGTYLWGELLTAGLRRAGETG